MRAVQLSPPPRGFNRRAESRRAEPEALYLVGQGEVLLASFWTLQGISALEEARCQPRL